MTIGMHVSNAIKAKCSKYQNFSKFDNFNRLKELFCIILGQSIRVEISNYFNIKCSGYYILKLRNYLSGRDDFTLLSEKHCLFGTILDSPSYPTLDEAQSACASNQNCTGVYDFLCDNEDSFFLCSQPDFDDSGFRSCIYQKSGKAANVWYRSSPY